MLLSVGVWWGNDVLTSKQQARLCTCGRSFTDWDWEQFTCHQAIVLIDRRNDQGKLSGASIIWSISRDGEWPFLHPGPEWILCHLSHLFDHGCGFVAAALDVCWNTLTVTSLTSEWFIEKGTRSHYSTSRMLTDLSSVMENPSYIL